MSWVILVFAMSMFWSWNGKSRRRLSRQEESRIAALEAEVAGRDDSIVALETCVAELESRLDFAERLLSTPQERESIR
jgi:uncharacterized coiled-coil protein SlyX